MLFSLMAINLIAIPHMVKWLILRIEIAQSVINPFVPNY